MIHTLIAVAAAALSLNSALAVDVQLLCRGPVQSIQVQEMYTYSPQAPTVPNLTFKVFAQTPYRPDGGAFGSNLRPGECSIMGPDEQLRTTRLAVNVSLATMRAQRQPTPDVFQFVRNWDDSAKTWRYSVNFLYGLENPGLYRVYAERNAPESFTLKTNRHAGQPPVERIGN